MCAQIWHMYIRFAQDTYACTQTCSMRIRKKGGREGERGKERKGEEGRGREREGGREGERVGGRGREAKREKTAAHINHLLKLYSYTLT